MNAHRLFFVVNLDPLEESAHALYTVRHVRSLAITAPAGWSVSLICPTSGSPADIATKYDLAGLPALEVVTLPSIRRNRDGRGLHINAVFHWAAWFFLKKNARPGDIVASASFPRLFEFLATRFLRQPKPPILAYEVHQLECLSRPENHPKCVQEFRALALADRLLTTTAPLEKILRARDPDKPRARTGLAASYEPVELRTIPADAPLRIGYFGSVSPEQGIPWLVENWPRIRSGSGNPELQIFGRLRPGESLPASSAADGIFVCESVPASEVPACCVSLDALIIPALDQGHRAAIAFTKAYDYAGLALPIIASDLPTIREVIREGTEALFFPPGHLPALTKALATLAGDAELRDRMHTACVERARELAWDARAERWWEAVLP